ncbi:MAG TPA: DUF58 domain-containing protein [Phycisphaerae bacterium]|nr:DUF58 domain-containing protein [Phycisphaerae bacterium]
MIPRELLKKVRQIEIRTSRMADDVLAGQYHSAFKGRGMEFEEVREYQIGDEVRSIDWNVTARQGRPFVKTYREERELTVILVVDVSGSERFGSGLQQKSELAAEFAALIAFSAIRNNDKAGLLMFTDRVERFIPPKKGTQHVLRLIRELLGFKPESGGTDVGVALEYLGRVMRRRAVIFVISDFICDDFERDLAAVHSRHDIIAVRIQDRREQEMPNVGLATLQDAETGELCVIDTGSARVRAGFGESSGRDRARQDRLLRSLKVDELSITTSESYVQQLQAFFRMREKKMYR